MKKTGVLISVILVLSIFVPVFAFAGKPDKDPRILEKRVFIHYKKGHGKPDWVADKKPPKDDGHSDDYALLGKGVAWKDGMPLYVQVNPTNGGVGGVFMEGAVDAALTEWDSHTSTDLFADAVVNEDATFDYNSIDGFNEIVFGDYAESGVIAICYTWGYFSGKPSSRRIVEFDIMLDTDYTWGDGADVNSVLMDVQNIVTHELGHGLGLADIYDCNLETMYGYSGYDDIVKRDLFDGDIAGLQELYGK
ncbi:matrixin family metalloprotease [Candidatus Bathyarchaeota archaeon]|nr:matrixin family metalloprotease [Candidatus Bathyarchaeota archaeon]